MNNSNRNIETGDIIRIHWTHDYMESIDLMLLELIQLGVFVFIEDDGGRFDDFSMIEWDAVAYKSFDNLRAIMINFFGSNNVKGIEFLGKLDGFKIK